MGRLIRDPDGDRFVILVPVELRQRLIAVHHDSVVGGHLGAFKTTRKIQASYSWFGMSRDVARYVRKCHKCQVFKAENALPKGLMGTRDQLVQPWDNLCIDLTGPFPRSRSGNTHLLVVTDQLTKWVELFPLREATARAVAKVLVGEIFPRFGVPRNLISDNGRQFVARVVKWVCRLFGVKQNFTSFYHPQPNQAERAIKTVKSLIAKNVDLDHRTWDLDLPYVAMGIRTAVSEGTGFTPAFLVFGRELRTPGCPSGDEVRMASEDDEGLWAVEIASRARRAIARAQQALSEREDRNKKAYDERHRDVRFEVGDVVLRRAHPISSAVKGFMAKLAPKWEGPWVIREVCSPVTYKVGDPKTGDLCGGTRHVSDLAAYYSGGETAIPEKSPKARRKGVGRVDKPMVWLDETEREENRRSLRVRGPAQNRLRQAIVDLMRGTRRSGDTSK